MSENKAVDDPEVQMPLIRGKELYADFFCITQMQTEELSYMWTIKDFNKLCSSGIKVISSENFFSNITPHVVWKLILKIGPKAQSNLVVEVVLVDDFSEFTIFVKGSISILGADLDKRHSTRKFECSLNEGEKWIEDNFISKSELQEKADKLLSRNSLVIFCKISQSGYFNTQKEENIRIHDDSELEDFSKLFENSLFSDALINVKGHIFKVHKAIIASRCSVFMAMFNPEIKMKEHVEGIAFINDTSVEIFREILRYIYTARVENIEKIVGDLIIAADKYNLIGLKTICEKTIYKILNVQNAMEFLITVDYLNIKLLKEKILKFITRNLTAVIAQDNWTDVLNNHTKYATEILQMLIAD